MIFNGLLGKVSPCRSLLLLELGLCKFSLFIERVEDLAEELLFANAPNALTLYMKLCIPQKCVKFLIFRLLTVRLKGFTEIS